MVSQQTVSVQVERPTKGVWLTAEQNPDLLWSDNMLDLFPDQPRRLHVSGLRGQTLHADWLHS
ncbi:glycoside hydrolase family 2 protein [Tengunoibacter tsumagoiensis]|uniref:glycoside hydrolase family 2 protein n=1 Tax=Tengunoibacter tsumagoiensis TaxID=2014871 RepID=UPI002482E33F|nr:glycoside hydrolase family 2 protein [Tengunoibacter tsumagoiensis]